VVTLASGGDLANRVVDGVDDKNIAGRIDRRALWLNKLRLATDAIIFP
jgi:hypothetical protein